MQRGLTLECRTLRGGTAGPGCTAGAEVRQFHSRPPSDGALVEGLSHTFGLLNNSFRPPEEIRTLRGYLRQRENLVAAAATCIQHMQKALTEMNIQLANVISDISGTTGLAILCDIVRGERDSI